MGGEFGVLLRQRRLQAGLTQEDLAGRAQVGVRTLRGLETGERVGPRLDTVRRIVEALELPVDG
ncbi:helix-turn-helix transcriptional regulator, partial [Crossiella equi]